MCPKTPLLVRKPNICLPLSQNHPDFHLRDWIRKIPLVDYIIKMTVKIFPK